MTFAANGGNALSGAISAGGAEYIAQVTAQTLFKKDAKDLTADEKETVSSISQIVGTLSGSVTGDSSLNAYVGGNVAKNAVENNYLTAKQLIEVEKAYVECGNDELCKERVVQAAKNTSQAQDMRLTWAKLQCGLGSCDELNAMNQEWVRSLDIRYVVKELQKHYPNISYQNLLKTASQYSTEADNSFNQGSKRVIVGALEDLPIIGGLGGAAVKNSGRAVTQTFAKQAERKAAKKATDEAQNVAKVENRFYAEQPFNPYHTGRYEPRSLQEKLAMEEVVANPSTGKLVTKKDPKTGQKTPLPMNDPYGGWYSKDGWVKMSKRVGNTEIHYIHNKKTGEYTDFKFIDQKGR